jgi:hypothetical protein
MPNALPKKFMVNMTPAIRAPENHQGQGLRIKSIMEQLFVGLKNTGICPRLGDFGHN